MQISHKDNCGCPICRKARNEGPGLGKRVCLYLSRELESWLRKRPPAEKTIGKKIMDIILKVKEEVK